MASAGFLTTLKVGGTPTAFTGAATTDLGGNTFQVTDATKRVFYPGAAVQVYDDLVELGPTDFAVNYLFGTVELVAPPSGDVTVSGSFVPLLPVAESRTVTVNMTRAELDTSIHGEAFTKLVVGKKSAEVSLETLAPLTQDMDAGAGTVTWDATFGDGSPLLVEVAFLTGRMWRGWCRVPSLGEASPQDGLYTGSVTAKSVTLPATGRADVISFSLGEG